jgi:hypothetical protein
VVEWASDLDATTAEALQFTYREGPCLQVYTHRKPVLMPDLTSPASPAWSRWPTYTAELRRRTDYHGVFVYPLLANGVTLGALSLYRHTPGAPAAPGVIAPIAARITDRLSADLAHRHHRRTLSAMAEQHDQPPPPPGLDSPRQDRASQPPHPRPSHRPATPRPSPPTASSTTSPPDAYPFPSAHRPITTTDRNDERCGHPASTNPSLAEPRAPGTSFSCSTHASSWRYKWSMADPREPDQSWDRLRQRSEAAQERAGDLMGELADTAGRIAQTETDIARVQEEIAGSGVSRSAEQAREQTEKARAFAAHEREEQRRWSGRARDQDRPER